MGPKSSFVGDRHRLPVWLGFEFFLGAMLVFGGECHQIWALAFSPLLKQAGALCILLAVYVIIFLLLYFVPHPERKIN